ncbi:MAG: hypothetical protein ABJC05_02220 [Pyrinomonadaceae bacterium]
MRHIKNLSALVIAFMLAALPCGFAVTGVSAQTQVQDQTQDQAQSGALPRGYRTGYSDGYAAGFQDAAQHAARAFQNKSEYQQGNRNYSPAYGAAEDYRDGYQQGFEGGYNAGFDHRGFDSTIPGSLARRGNATAAPADTSDDSVGNPNATSPADNAPANSPTNSNVSNPSNTSNSSPVYHSTNRGTVTIPRNTVMRVELLTNLSTDATQRGDRFQARVIEPSEYEGAILDGQVTQVKRPGKVKGTAQLQLSFEQIRLPDNRVSHLSAQVIEVIHTNSNQGVGSVDSEGGVRGDSTTRSDVTRVGTATGIGALIGAIAGGGRGAAIGAAIGAGIGTAGVVTDEGKDIHLRQGQELKIRTANDATIS